MKNKPITAYTLFVIILQTMFTLLSLCVNNKNMFIEFLPSIILVGIPLIIAYITIIIGEFRK